MSLLDRATFSTRDPLSRELLQAVLTLYYKPEPVQRFVEEAGMPKADFRWERALKDVWPDVLETAARLRRLRRLVEVIARDPDTDAYSVFTVLLAQEPPAGGEDPYDVRVIGRDRPKAFIDRLELRSHLRDLLHDNGGRVLVVSGDRATGKSWTWYLISHVLSCLGHAAPYLVDLNIWAGAPAGPGDVMGELTDQLGWDRCPIDPHESQDTLGRKLLSHFKGRMRHHDDADCWLVFDGLDADDLTEPALRMIEGIATAAERREAGGRLRVVLIAYDQDLPPHLATWVHHEVLRPLNTADLRDFFNGVAGSIDLQLTDEAVDVLVRSVLEEAFGGEPPPEQLPVAAVSYVAACRARRLISARGGARA
ncbi:effector-associated domain EAD1-containing protein [Streptomyces sp. NPDC059447]|uniref:effector-associated domain EAD1-containing protein n=1 Tax=Streptomyces sp. NPDC059447 TaxID=3346834 RepID=UPI0036BCB334